MGIVSGIRVLLGVVFFGRAMCVCRNAYKKNRVRVTPTSAYYISAEVPDLRLSSRERPAVVRLST